MALIPWAGLTALLLAAENLVAPVPKTPTLVSLPSNAPPLTEILEVRANLLLDETGEVERVELVGGPNGVYGEAVLVAATHFAFSPATADGKPIPAGITFSQQFAPSVAEAPPVPRGTLEVVVAEKGTGNLVGGAEVHAVVAGTDVHATTDSKGMVRLEIAAGSARVHVARAEYKDFTVSEEIHANEALKVRYLLERSSYLDYQTTVIGKSDRTEVSRTVLAGSEITQVPGTFGDPFRVISALPGVSSLFSLLGFYIVQGTTPSSTAFMVDQVAIPNIYHLLAGPSVIHPEFIDRINFYPGTFPADYGGYIGGIIDGITRRVVPDERRIEVDLNLLDVGAFLRGPLGGGFTGTAAGRYGYPGLLLGAFDAPVGLTYWDYQGRLDGPLGSGRLKIFAFGAFDELTNVNNGVSQLDYGTQFHRIDLTWLHESDKFYQSYSLILGLDETTTGAISDLLSPEAWVRGRWHLKVLDNLTFRAGVDVGVTGFKGDLTVLARLDPSLSDQSSAIIENYGVYIDAPWWPHPDLQIDLGIRVDAYSMPSVTQVKPDPRLGLRWRVASEERGDTWLKAGAGWFHQPPRLSIPLPGYEEVGLKQGLTSSYQAMLGAEVPVGSELDVDVQAYFSYMDQIVLDLALNYDPADPIVNLGGDSGLSPLLLFGALQDPDEGRSYGLELTLRHRNVGNFFGWLSYTLSRSERLRDGRWYLYDYDHTHLISAVGGWRLPRDWQIGGRFQFASGRPITPNTPNPVYNSALSPAFYRIDVRVDKRVAYDSWVFDFYVDIINITVASEYLDTTDQDIPYILPNIGVRGEF